MGSAICMYNKKSTDNLQSLAISVSCLTSNGKFLIRQIIIRKYFSSIDAAAMIIIIIYYYHR